MADLTDWLFQKTVGRHIPLSVHIDLTMRCNERCIHCYRVIEIGRASCRERVSFLV